MKYCTTSLTVLLIVIFFAARAPLSAEGQKRPSSGFLMTTKKPISEIVVVYTYPHDPESFTEGLVYHQGYLYESTGLNGKSSSGRTQQ